ncbi:MAG TPA: ABC transporter substrate-binding protein [Acidimicrobiia bacterium]|nr:ABC transporter substrate-binding protein [Acidimicrobiia bacterium]
MQHDAEPILVGVLDDVPSGADPSGASTQERVMRLPIERARRAGRIDRPVEFVRERADGLPFGTAHAVEVAYRRLVERGVVMVVGPAIGDNALVATPLAEAARVPTVHYAGAERARGEFVFHLQVGSHEEEPVLIAQHLAAHGLRRVALIRDQSPIGRRYADFFLRESEPLGVQVIRSLSVSPVGEPADAVGDAVAEAVGSGPDAVVYLGLGFGGYAVGRALAERGRPLPVVCNTCGMFAHGLTEWREVWDGWVYVDEYADDNEVLAGVRAELGLAPEQWSMSEAIHHDLGLLVAEGLARSEELSRDGVRDGLERIKMVPSAEGEPGTFLGFGRWDRAALKGRFLVLRTWREGRSVQITG